MANITIKDLPESIDLDQAAMTAIIGGSRIRGRAAIPTQTILRSTRIISYPGRPATLGLANIRKNP